MSEFFAGLSWWHWLIASAALAVIEMLLPGASAIWLAAGAAVVGVLTLILPISWPWQLIAFAVLSVAALLLWWRYHRRSLEISDRPKLNQRAEQYVGSVCVLAEPIQAGYGKARVGDGVWKVRGPDLPAGAQVRVVATEGALLVVEAA